MGWDGDPDFIWRDHKAADGCVAPTLVAIQCRTFKLLSKTKTNQPESASIAMKES